ncbi:hypothetical protein [Staphylococcus rostri]|uniref:hypothetical protein n=1 Tax=Staphylococcus rostri TaxID=522262 RepID=UPI002852BCF8|nr:hypothetical protein [Staphylococcus rostri]
MSVHQAADKWDTSEQTVKRLRTNGEIAGAVYENNQWKLAIDAINPLKTPSYHKK